MKKSILAAVVATTFVSAAHAEKKTFDFKDPKGVNNVTFTLDAPLESISGTASDVSGTLTLDPENPAEVEGKIIVAAESLHVPNPMMKSHMHGDGWLNVQEHETIEFEVKEVKNVERDGDSGTAEVSGTFTLHGVSKDVTVPATVTYLPGRLGDRIPDAKGDLLVIRADWTIKRSEFEIKPGEAEDKVADEIALSMAIAGAAPDEE
ncbi:MAG: YceI family protein [Chthoniobacterales bacterium]